ncbi:MAG: tRNA (adenosine(37)-N6)-threonylcarbamoyltransferase complex ATPase subunit type 1 TsaE [Candidatus Marinimicrobia bacterium]|nr:tRNA (adenosine(37)-N6)-threonylcarbamoyltransferase complex ATPase subunit type 1 TsaE [Candidatus Neomarinimicrobiota bacterium]
MKKQIITNSERETTKLGNKLAKLLAPGDIIAFIGDLAAGKTTLITGICEQLGVEEDVGSPTFTLINEYNGKFPVYHIDCYREHNIRGWIDIGIEEYLYSQGITLIEWAEMIEEILPPSTIKIEIKQDFKRKNWRAFTLSIPDQSNIEQKDLNELKERAR